MGAPGDDVVADEDKVLVPGEAAKAGETLDAHEPATQKDVAEESDGKQLNGDSAAAVEKDATGAASMDDAAEEDEEVGRQKEEALRQALLKKKDGGQDHKDEKAGKSDRKRERRCVRSQNVGPNDGHARCRATLCLSVRGEPAALCSPAPVFLALFLSLYAT